MPGSRDLEEPPVPERAVQDATAVYRISAPPAEREPEAHLEGLAAQVRTPGLGAADSLLAALAREATGPVGEAGAVADPVRAEREPPDRVDAAAAARIRVEREPAAEAAAALEAVG